jgi:hypothetical protein
MYKSVDVFAAFFTMTNRNGCTPVFRPATYHHRQKMPSWPVILWASIFMAPSSL